LVADAAVCAAAAFDACFDLDEVVGFVVFVVVRVFPRVLPLWADATEPSVLSVGTSASSVETVLSVDTMESTGACAGPSIAGTEAPASAGAADDAADGENADVKNDKGSNPMIDVIVSRRPPRLRKYATQTEQKNMATALKTIMGSLPDFLGDAP
jgi:hypothetical protein